jgi:multiple sugar transport system substrate-binding protein
MAKSVFDGKLFVFMIDFLTRRRFLALSAAAAGSTLLGGCNRRERFEDGKLVLDFYTPSSPEFNELYENKLVPAFEKKYPKIKVRVNSSLGDAGYDAKLLTLIAGKMAPDIFHVTQTNFPFYANKGIALPVDDFVARDQDISRDSFYKKLLDGLTVGGKLVGLPTDFSTIIMFYNKDMFDKQKIKYPQPDWTRDDYLEKCRAFTRDTDKDGYVDQWGTTNPDAYNRWPTWVWNNGGDIFTPDESRCVMDTPAAIEGLDFYVGLSEREKVAPTSEQSMGQGFQEQFMARRVAMIADSRFAYKRFLKKKGLPFAWDVAPMPTAKTQATTFIWGANCIYSKTPYPEESWQLLKFLSNEVGAAINLEAGNALPAYREAAENAVRNREDPRAPANDIFFLDAVKYGRQAPFPPQYADFNAAMNRLHDAYLGLATTEEVCRDFTKEVNAILTSKAL